MLSIKPVLQCIEEFQSKAAIHAILMGMGKIFDWPGYRCFGRAGILTGFVLLLSHGSGVQAQSALKPVCIGIASLEPAKSRRACCHNQAKGQCLKWEQLFPESKQRPNPSAPKSKLRVPFMQVQKPEMNFDSNVPRSEGAAKDAVIQMGVNKLLELVKIRPKTAKSGTKPGHPPKPNFFERMSSHYERVLKPRSIGGTATLAPQMDVGVDLSDVSLRSMKAGVKIEF
jgi:hypothetical protein